MSLQFGMTSLDNKPDFLQFWCDCKCGTQFCYHLVGSQQELNTALQDMLIVVPNKNASKIGAPLVFTYLNGDSDCLKKYLAKRYDSFVLSDYSPDSIRHLEKTLGVTVYFPPHTKEFINESFRDQLSKFGLDHLD